ncbi:cyclic nucleotide-binding protein [Thauera phenylacetica B4P]|jgi:CRP-like cAMP-binding protein|uniref:Cyclic nucleotide-binding protein n=1 Tax=Thauera phenylacetica B4P TaxID=1234382 RepID=N6Z2H7_9RHOO|nr:Crp/Fnr family transcriptional regulator [Thauera phenylacetica]ENO98090.1 cyclic nucleotide-binding protein [Thauera phenylacetica B4P]
MSEPLPPPAGENRILATLPADERARLMDDLEQVTLPLGHVLYEPGDVLGFVYFPTSCIVSLVFTTENGATAELAMIGKDGLVGIPLVLGGGTSTHKAVVQCAGTAWRLRADVMTWELNQHGHLLRLALSYTQALMTQMAQSVVCNRHHAVDQQLCRWLLLSLDQLPDNQLNMTQELIANMLGVRREAVTEAAGKLQAAGLIQYRRGQITVTDRPGLEARACECYSVVRAEYERLFHLPQVILPSDRARPNPATLRKRAEARLEKEKADRLAASNAASDAEADAAWQQARLVHELEVHQIELEMSNEALRQAYDDADALHRKYADIYDFAPIPYFTLDEAGVIVQFNLAGAILLDIQRSHTRPHRFAAFVKPEFLPVFNDFLDEKLRGRCRRSCELVLLATAHHPERPVRIQAVTDESGREIQMAVLDIFPSGQAADHDRRHTDPQHQVVNDRTAQASAQ